LPKITAIKKTIILLRVTAIKKIITLLRVTAIKKTITLPKVMAIKKTTILLRVTAIKKTMPAKAESLKKEFGVTCVYTGARLPKKAPRKADAR